MSSPPSSAKPASAAPTAAAAAPPPPPGPMIPYPDWSAYYAAAGAAPPPGAFYPPPTWGTQAMMPPPYGAGMPYPHPMYYAHPGYPNGEMQVEEKGRGKKKRAARGKLADGGSSSEDEEGSESGESGSEGSSATGDEGTEQQDSVGRKRGRTEGEGAHTGMESSHGGRVRKLPVSRATVPGPTTNLNMGMEAWNAPHAGTVQFAPNMSIAPLMPGHEGAMLEQRLTKLDEREIRREKRKQSNRESARRSRMRKQQECDELARRVQDLASENSTLRTEVERYRNELEQLNAENTSLMESLKKKSPEFLTEEEQAFLCADGAAPAAEGNGFVESLVVQAAES